MGYDGPMPIESDLLSSAHAWAAQDPDPETRAAWLDFASGATPAELEERLRPLGFGTAGLRAPVGAGPSRMNIAVIRRATRAVAEVAAREVGATRRAKVIVGYDARLSSRGFAECAAAVLAGAGVEPLLFEDSVPTPLVAYAARRFATDAAIVITSSHNPAEYNGYKVYGPDAAPITGEWETALSACFDAVGPANRIPIAESSDVAARRPWRELSTEEFFDAYLSEVDGLRAPGACSTAIGIVYTALHGVGGRYTVRALQRAGHDDLHIVAEQQAPDGRFPTIANPNPEDPTALALALGLADRVGAALILANDPDSDRLAVAVRDAGGAWRHLHGNEVGVLLADDLLARAPSGGEALITSTLVSTPMVDSIACAHGARIERTLTGFKWLWRASLELSTRNGWSPMLAFEEAIGFSPGGVVRDKDGISSAVLVADIARREAERGRTLLDRLRELQQRHGQWVSVAANWVLPGAAGQRRIAGLLDELVGAPPSSLGRHALVGLRDWRVDEAGRPAWRSATALVKLEFQHGEIWVRPSGTEPKLKAYCNWRSLATEPSDATEGAARCDAEAVLRAFGEFCRV